MSAAEQTNYNKLSINEEIKKCLVEAVIEVLTTVSGFHPQLTSEKIDHKAANSKGDVSGIVGLIQNDLEGSLILSFTKNLICKITSKVYGLQFDEMNESVSQAAGELTNMVMGGFKQRMNQSGFHLRMAIPSIVEGKAHSVGAFTIAETLELEFTVGEEKFFVLMALKN